MCTAALLVFRTVMGNVSVLPGCVCSSYLAGETSTEISAADGAVSASPRTALVPRVRIRRKVRITLLLSAAPGEGFSREGLPDGYWGMTATVMTLLDNPEAAVPSALSWMS